MNNTQMASGKKKDKRQETRDHKKLFYMRFDNELFIGYTHVSLQKAKKPYKTNLKRKPNEDKPNLYPNLWEKVKTMSNFDMDKIELVLIKEGHFTSNTELLEARAYLIMKYNATLNEINIPSVKSYFHDFQFKKNVNIDDIIRQNEITLSSMTIADILREYNAWRSPQKITAPSVTEIIKEYNAWRSQSLPTAVTEITPIPETPTEDETELYLSFMGDEEVREILMKMSRPENKILVKEMGDIPLREIVKIQLRKQVQK